jgi:hemerythrin superfamily protein
MPHAAKEISRATRSSPSKSIDATKLLKADHKEVSEMFEKFESGRLTPAKKEALAKQICTALSMHAQIEEEIFYPAAREAAKKADQTMLDEAEVEHGSIKDLVAAIEDGSASALFEANVHVLGEYVKHHVKEEETELFPALKSTDMDMEEIGARLAQRKEELMPKAGK